MVVNHVFSFPGGSICRAGAIDERSRADTKRADTKKGAEAPLVVADDVVRSS